LPEQGRAVQASIATSQSNRHRRINRGGGPDRSESSGEQTKDENQKVRKHEARKKKCIPAMIGILTATSPLTTEN
jgi:hypothetical protein